MLECPMPGDVIGDVNKVFTVVASGHHSEEPEVIYGVLLIDKNGPPYFIVAEMKAESGAILELGKVSNIVPATRLFDELFGFWGDGPLDWEAATFS